MLAALLLASIVTGCTALGLRDYRGFYMNSLRLTPSSVPPGGVALVESTAVWDIPPGWAHDDRARTALYECSAGLFYVADYHAAVVPTEEWLSANAQASQQHAEGWGKVYWVAPSTPAVVTISGWPDSLAGAGPPKTVQVTVE